jgi:hypothetical protein
VPRSVERKMRMPTQAILSDRTDVGEQSCFMALTT